MSTTPKTQTVRIDLPDTDDYGPGQWAEIRNPTKVTKGDRDELRIASFKSIELDDNGKVANVGVASVASFDALLRHWVIAWSLTRPDGTPLPVPADLPEDELDGLDIDIVDALETALTPVLDKINGRRDTKPSADPQSPSVPSAA